MMRRAKHVENKRCAVQRKKTLIWSRRDGDSIVYMHRNRRNGKIYIGFTTRSCFERWTYQQYKRNGRNNYFYNALIKEKELYEAAGIQSDDIFLGFESRILVGGLSAEDAPEVEKVTIAFLKDKGIELYNRTDGGEAPPIHRGDNNPMKKAEIVARCKNAVNRPEARQAKSKALGKPVEAINPETGLRAYYFISARSAERFGFYHKRISECCNNERKTYRGLLWRFAKPESDQQRLE